MKNKKNYTRLLVIASVILVLVPASVWAWGNNAKVDDSVTSKKLESLPVRKGPKPQVTIYQFNSTVSEISPASATDMFTTALVKSHSFAVLERQRLEESVNREKQLNQQGSTTGNVAQSRLTGANYIFVGTITEANAQASKTGVAGTYKGLGVEKSGEAAEIGLDVRVLDAKTGAVLDAVNVRKKVKQGGFSVKGVGSFFSRLTHKNLGGADAGVNHDSKEGIDKALRACIEEAIYELAKRYGQ